MESILFNKTCLRMKIIEDKYISQAFKTSEKTGTLNMSGYTPSLKLCEAMSYVISKSISIVEFIAKDCLIPSKGLSVILGAIKNNGRVTEICLTGNNILSQTTIHLANLIQSNPSLKVLSLKWNNLGTCKETFKLFCNALSKNKTIEYLDLRNNQITTECAVYLAKALADNKTIKKMDLRCNLLDKKGAELLVSSIEKNKNSVQILLSKNPVDPEVVSSLGICSKYKDGLKSIQTTYEAKLNILTKHIREMENRRIDHVDKLCKDSKLHIQNAEGKINKLTMKLSENESLIKELNHQLKENRISVESEKKRADMLEQMVDEKEKNYIELINKYQFTIESLRQELLKLENDCAQKKITDDKKYLNEKSKREQAENERDFHQKNADKYKQELDKVLDEFNITVKVQIEKLEKDKKDWQTKYKNLERQYSEDFQKLTESAAERQRKLEITILDLTEKQAKNMEAVSEKLEHCLGEKALVEGQLTSALAAISRLQQENSELINQLAQPSRRLAQVLQELSDEKLSNEKLRLEKCDIEKKLEEARQISSGLREEMSQASETAAELSRQQRQHIQAIKGKALILAQKLKERDSLIAVMREEEHKRAKGLYTAVSNYMEHLPAKTH